MVRISFFRCSAVAFFCWYCGFQPTRCLLEWVCRRLAESYFREKTGSAKAIKRGEGIFFYGRTLANSAPRHMLAVIEACTASP